MSYNKTIDAFFLRLTPGLVNRRKRCPPRLRLGGRHFLGLTNPDVNLKRLYQLYNVNLIGHVGLETMFEINGCIHA